MSTIVLRNTKGSPLTWVEGDDNFNNLNTDKIEAVLDDAAPQLGGNLDVNDNTIESGANNQIRFGTNGAEMVFEKQEIVEDVFASVIRADNLQFVTMISGGTSILNSSSGASVSAEYGDGTIGPVNIRAGSSGQVNIVTNDTGLNGLFTASFNKDNLYDWDNTLFSDPTYGAAINCYDIGASASAPLGLKGSAVIIATPDASSIVLNSGADADIKITPNGTGDLVLDGLKWPQADGTADYVLKTDGSAQLSWVAQTTAFDPASPGAIGGTTAAAVTATTLTFKDPREAIYDIGTSGGTITPDVVNGSVQKITLNSALTFNAFGTPVAGQSLTLIIYGGTAYTSITSTMKFAGGVKTLTGTASCIDILSVYYDGTTYFASLGKGFA